MGADRASILQQADPEGAHRTLPGDRRRRGSSLVLYNIPGRTGVNMLPETVAQLADHPNIVG